MDAYLTHLPIDSFLFDRLLDVCFFFISLCSNVFRINVVSWNAKKNDYTNRPNNLKKIQFSFEYEICEDKWLDRWLDYLFALMQKNWLVEFFYGKWHFIEYEPLCNTNNIIPTTQHSKFIPFWPECKTMLIPTENYVYTYTALEDLCAHCLDDFAISNEDKMKIYMLIKS